MRFIAGRVAGDAEAESLAEESERWIEANLGERYRWPGNFRELEQCVRNVMVRGEYRPPARPRPPHRAREVDRRLLGELRGEA